MNQAGAFGGIRLRYEPATSQRNAYQAHPHFSVPQLPCAHQFRYGTLIETRGAHRLTLAESQITTKLTMKAQRDFSRIFVPQQCLTNEQRLRRLRHVDAGSFSPSV
jgi:hypothetical protein